MLGFAKFVFFAKFFKFFFASSYFWHTLCKSFLSVISFSVINYVVSMRCPRGSDDSSFFFVHLCTKKMSGGAEGGGLLRYAPLPNPHNRKVAAVWARRKPCIPSSSASPCHSCFFCGRFAPVWRFAVGTSFDLLDIDLVK